MERGGPVVVRRDDGTPDELALVVGGRDDPGPFRRVEKPGQSELLGLGQGGVVIGGAGAAHQGDEVGPLAGVEAGQG